MSYAYWENEKNIKKYLNKINIGEEINSSGLPIVYENNNCYITNNNAHSLIVGSAGSGKTQSMILPLIKLSLLAGESVIINDVKGELYAKTANEFKKRGYNVLVLDFNSSIYGNYWNPLTLPRILYKEGNVDKALNSIESLGYYLFKDNNSKEVLDPFWINSVIDYFTGLCLYLFKNDDDITLKDIYNLSNKLTDKNEREKFLKEIGRDNSIYYNVAATLESPDETRGGIIATFNQKFKKFISRDNLSNMMSKSDFDITKVSNEKTALFIISGYYDHSNNLIPLFINQIVETINAYENNNKYINVILDEFDRLLPIKDFVEVINYSRSLKIRFTVVIKSYIDLINTYGKEDFELIKYCFFNIIYLLSNDIYTLEEISKLCGNKCENKVISPLASIEDLKLLDTYEAVILLPRIMPFRTKLVPDYKINWGFSEGKAILEERK